MHTYNVNGLDELGVGAGGFYGGRDCGWGVEMRWMGWRLVLGSGVVV